MLETRMAPAVATHFLVSGLPASVTAGTLLTLTATAEDQYGNLDTTWPKNKNLSFTSSDPQAVLPANYSISLNHGTATFKATLKTAGSQTITVSDFILVGFPPQSHRITGTSSPSAVSPAPAAKFVVKAPSASLVGTPYNFTVTAIDAYNNTATGYRDPVHFTSSDNLAVLPANTTLTSGAGTFSATLETDGSQTLTVTDTVNSSLKGISSPITVSGAATHFVVTGPSSATAGTACTFKVTAEDALGYTAAVYSGTVHFASSDAQATLPKNATLSNGVGQFTVTLKTAGNQSLTATDTVTSSLTGKSAAVTVNPAAVSKLSVHVPSSTTAGSAFSCTVTAQDPYGNTTTSYSGGISFTSSDSQAVLPTKVTLTSGTGTFQATLKSAGSQTITASILVSQWPLSWLITGTSAPVTVKPGPVAKFLVQAPEDGACWVGHNCTITVTAEDAYGNTVPTCQDMVHFTSSDPKAVLPAHATLTKGSGQFQILLQTPGTQTVTATDTANSAISGTSGGITVGYPTPVTITTTSVKSGLVSWAYSWFIHASGGLGALTWYGGAPDGLTLTTGGLLYGTPLQAGHFNFSITVADDFGDDATQEYILIIM